jgi:hypothetical protein
MAAIELPPYIKAVVVAVSGSGDIAPRYQNYCKYNLQAPPQTSLKRCWRLQELIQKLPNFLPSLPSTRETRCHAGLKVLKARNQS